MSTNYETDFDAWAYVKKLRTNLTDGTEFKFGMDRLHQIFSEGMTFLHSIRNLRILPMYDE